MAGSGWRTRSRAFRAIPSRASRPGHLRASHDLDPVAVETLGRRFRRGGLSPGVPGDRIRSGGGAAGAIGDAERAFERASPRA